eukprot:Rhum_TRINITY_DN534_c0_g1::Rhum_TRINITY_DN534_c0_g1_i1::g.1555::m.1555
MALPAWDALPAGQPAQRRRRRQQRQCRRRGSGGGTGGNSRGGRVRAAGAGAHPGGAARVAEEPGHDRAVERGKGGGTGYGEAGEAGGGRRRERGAGDVRAVRGQQRVARRLPGSGGAGASGAVAASPVRPRRAGHPEGPAVRGGEGLVHRRTPRARRRLLRVLGVRPRVLPRGPSDVHVADGVCAAGDRLLRQGDQRAPRGCGGLPGVRGTPGELPARHRHRDARGLLLALRAPPRLPRRGARGGVVRRPVPQPLCRTPGREPSAALRPRRAHARVEDARASRGRGDGRRRDRDDAHRGAAHAQPENRLRRCAPRRHPGRRGSGGRRGGQAVRRGRRRGVEPDAGHRVRAPVPRARRRAHPRRGVPADRGAVRRRRPAARRHRGGDGEGQDAGERTRPLSAVHRREPEPGRRGGAGGGGGRVRRLLQEVLHELRGEVSRKGDAEARGAPGGDVPAERASRGCPSARPDAALRRDARRGAGGAAAVHPRRGGAQRPRRRDAAQRVHRGRGGRGARRGRLRGRRGRVRRAGGGDDGLHDRPARRRGVPRARGGHGGACAGRGGDGRVGGADAGARGAAAARAAAAGDGEAGQGAQLRRRAPRAAGPRRGRGGAARRGGQGAGGRGGGGARGGLGRAPRHVRGAGAAAGERGAAGRGAGRLRGGRGRHERARVAPRVRGARRVPARARGGRGGAGAGRGPHPAREQPRRASGSPAAGHGGQADLAQPALGRGRARGGRGGAGGGEEVREGDPHAAAGGGRAVRAAHARGGAGRDAAAALPAQPAGGTVPEGAPQGGHVAVHDARAVPAHRDGQLRGAGVPGLRAVGRAVCGGCARRAGQAVPHAGADEAGVCEERSGVRSGDAGAQTAASRRERKLQRACQRRRILSKEASGG